MCKSCSVYCCRVRNRPAVQLQTFATPVAPKGRNQPSVPMWTKGGSTPNWSSCRLQHQQPGRSLVGVGGLCAEMVPLNNPRQDGGKRLTSATSSTPPETQSRPRYSPFWKPCERATSSLRTYIVQFLMNFDDVQKEVMQGHN